MASTSDFGVEPAEGMAEIAKKRGMEVQVEPGREPSVRR